MIDCTSCVHRAMPVILYLAAIVSAIGSMSATSRLANELEDCLPGVPRMQFVQTDGDVCLQFTNHGVSWNGAKSQCHHHNVANTRLVNELGDCPPGVPRTQLVQSFGEVCLQFVNDGVSWYGANKQCHHHGGHLVMIKDHEKQKFIVDRLTALHWPDDGVWIGATDHEQEGNWKWVDGSTVTYGNWHPGEGPSHSGFFFSKAFYEDCAMIRLDDGGRWNDCDCGTILYHHSYICEYKKIYRTSSNVISTITSSSSITTVKRTSVMLSTLTGTTTPSVTSAWNDVITTHHDSCSTCHTDAALTTPYNGLWLSFVVSSKSWKDADGQCRQHGGLLVEIHNQQDQDFIYDSLRSLNLTDAKCWIGATDRRTEGDWRWSDGSPVTYGQWKPGTGPSHTATNSNCALISVDDGGMWSDYGCDAMADHQVYVCQYLHS